MKNNKGFIMSLKGTFYIDGSCRSPQGSGTGKIGYGVHGYLYQDVAKSKPVLADDHQITNRGYLHKSKPLEDGVELVEPIKYIDAIGSSLDAATNNVAELYGFLTVIRKVLEIELQEVFILADSEYVIKGVKEWLPKWISQGWMKADGGPISNLPIWKEISHHLAQIKQQNISLDITWVRAHDHNHGNIHTDVLAAIGCNYSFNVELVQDWRESDPKGYWKHEVDRHPFITFRRIYFNSLADFNTPGLYYQADPGGNDYIIGKRLPETGYSIVRLQEPDPIIESVKQKQFDVSLSMNAIFMLKLDNAQQKGIYPYILNYGKYSLHKFKKNNNLVFVDDLNTPITSEINPTGLMLRAIDSFNFLEEMLDKYIHYRDHADESAYDDPFKILLQDITSVFYEMTEKGYTLKPEYIVGFKELKVTTMRLDRSFELPLILGTDMPSRNNLKRLEGFKPKITLITYSESDRSFHYGIIIECSNAIGIWSNFFASSIYF